MILILCANFFKGSQTSIFHSDMLYALPFVLPSDLIAVSLQNRKQIKCTPVEVRVDPWTIEVFLR